MPWLTGTKQSEEHKRKRLDSVRKSMAMESCKVKLRNNYRKMKIAMASDPGIEEKRKENLRKYAKENNIGERLQNHPNSIKSRFRNGDDVRRTGGRDFSEATRKQLAARMSAMASNQTGEKNHNWKGGVTSKHQKIRTGKEHHEWSVKVYERDHYTCQKCGIHCKNRNIVAHHIKSFANFESERFNINNGVTLCRACHARLHKEH